MPFCHVSLLCKCSFGAMEWSRDLILLNMLQPNLVMVLTIVIHALGCILSNVICSACETTYCYGIMKAV